MEISRNTFKSSDVDTFLDNVSKVDPNNAQIYFTRAILVKNRTQPSWEERMATAVQFAEQGLSCNIKDFSIKAKGCRILGSLYFELFLRQSQSEPSNLLATAEEYSQKIPSLFEVAVKDSKSRAKLVLGCKKNPLIFVFIPNFTNDIMEMSRDTPILYLDNMKLNTLAKGLKTVFEQGHMTEITLHSTDIDDDIIHALQNCRNLKKICISKEKHQVVILKDILQQTSDLIHFQVESIPFDSIELMEILKYVPELTLLNLNNCEISTEGVLSISERIPKLESLWLGKNPIVEFDVFSKFGIFFVHVATNEIS